MKLKDLAATIKNELATICFIVQRKPDKCKAAHEADGAKSISIMDLSGAILLLVVLVTTIACLATLL